MTEWIYICSWDHFMEIQMENEIEVDFNHKCKKGDIINFYIHNKGIIAQCPVLEVDEKVNFKTFFLQDPIVDHRWDRRKQEVLLEFEERKEWVQEKGIYWVYTMTERCYNEFSNRLSEDSGPIFFGLYSHADIQKDDMIIIFVKPDRGSGYFKSIMRVEDNIKENITKQTIFNDPNMNKFIFKIVDIIEFQNNLIYSKVVENVISEKKGLTSLMAFRKKFISNNYQMVMIPFEGYKLAQVIMNEKDGSKNCVEKIEEKKKAVSESEEKVDFSIDDDSSSESNSDDNYIPKDGIDMESGDSEDSDCEEIEETEEPENGRIPVMITPCKGFKISIKDEKDIIVQRMRDHIFECSECDITDNNNRSVINFFDKATIEIRIVKNERDGYFLPPLNDYYRGRKHDPIGATDKVFIRINIIVIPAHIHKSCFLIVWSDNAEIDIDFDSD